MGLAEDAWSDAAAAATALLLKFGSKWASGWVCVCGGGVWCGRVGELDRRLSAAGGGHWGRLGQAGVRAQLGKRAGAGADFDRHITSACSSGGDAHLVQQLWNTLVPSVPQLRLMGTQNVPQSFVNNGQDFKHTGPTPL